MLITTTAQPQTYPGSTVLCYLVLSLSAKTRSLAVVQGPSLTRNKPSHSFATPNPTPASLAQPPVSYGHSERLPGPACAVLGRDVPAVLRWEARV